jgi:hypothetical protein
MSDVGESLSASFQERSIEMIAFVLFVEGGKV